MKFPLPIIENSIIMIIIIIMLDVQIKSQPLRSSEFVARSFTLIIASGTELEWKHTQVHRSHKIEITLREGERGREKKG